jgi:hypothetical protein
MRDRSVKNRYLNDILLSLLNALSDSLGNLGSLADTLAYVSVSVTDDYEGCESHVTSALNSLGNTADVDDLLL